MSLEHVLEIVKTTVEPRLKEVMPGDGNILYGGSANALTRAIKSMGEFCPGADRPVPADGRAVPLARDSAMVVLAMPLATVGGVIALRLLNLVTFQPPGPADHDRFVILLGLVVNNAILLVHQTRSAERGDCPGSSLSNRPCRPGCGRSS